MSKKFKEKKPFSLRAFNVLIGILLTLIAIILTLNVGFPARIFTYIPHMLFGVGTLFIIIFLYVAGFLLVFKGKLFKIKFHHIIGAIIFILGFLVLFSSVMNWGKATASNFLDMFFNDSSLGREYFSDKNVTIDIYTNRTYTLSDNTAFGFAGGLVGNGLAGLLAMAWEGLPILVSIIFILGGIALCLSTYIRILATERKRLGDEAALDETKLPDDDTEAVEDPLIQANLTSEPQISSEPEEDYFHVKDAFEDSSTIGSFTKAVFAKDGSSSAGGSEAYTKAQQEEVVPSVAVFKEKAPVIEEDFEHEVKREQLSFDFDEPEEDISSKEETVYEVEEANVEPAPVQPIHTKPLEQKPVEQPKSEPQVKLEEEHAPTLQELIPQNKRIKWVAPSESLLIDEKATEAIETNERLAEKNAAILNASFEKYSIKAYVSGYTIGPGVTRYHIIYTGNGQNKQVANLVTDLSRDLGGVQAVFEETVPGETYSGLQVPNAVITTVSFKDIFEELPKDLKKHNLAIGFGKDIQGNVRQADFNEFPHALVAGTTGSGKSIFIHSVITTLIMRNSPEDLRLFLVDPKRTEMVRYKGMPHLLCPVESDPQKVKLVFEELVKEMENRFTIFEQAGACTDLKEFNEYAVKNNLPKMPYIICIVDEFGDLIMNCKEIKESLLRIGQKARAVGILMLLATQSPNSQIIDGLIKSNLPTIIGMRVTNFNQSTIVIGEGGEEKLLGKGDMFVSTALLGPKPVRLQGCYIQKSEISEVVNYLKAHYPTEYDERFVNLEEKQKAAAQSAVDAPTFQDDMDAAFEEKYQAVKEWVMMQQYMSMSKIQRDMGVGFNRAGRIFNRLQQEGIVATEKEGNQGCPVLIHDDSAAMFGDDEN